MANLWDHRDDSHRVAFVRLLQPLVSASRTKNFTVAEAAAYMRSMSDVPEDVIDEAVERLLQAGVTWMPRPGDIRRECVAVVSQRREHASAEVRPEDCPECHGTRWKVVDAAKNIVDRCDCHTRQLAVMATAAAPLALPAVPDEPAADETPDLWADRGRF